MKNFGKKNKFGNKLVILTICLTLLTSVFALSPNASVLINKTEEIENSIFLPIRNEFKLGEQPGKFPTYGPAAFSFSDVTLSSNGATDSGHYIPVFDLTACDLTLSFTYDATGFVDNDPGGADWDDHAWAAFGIREVGYGDFNPTYGSEGAGVWLATDYYDSSGGVDGLKDPTGGEDFPNLQDLDDKLILQKAGGHGEADYNLPTAAHSATMSHRIWFDRDGVDVWQAAHPLAVDGGTYNTGGTYDIVITLHATSATAGEAYMTINGLQQGWEDNGDWNNMEFAPAGMTFTGDMTQQQVYYGLYGYGSTYTAAFTNIIVTGCTACTSPIYVDDDWAGSTPGDIIDGHVYGYDAFDNIQDGVDNVCDGGTVNVYTGTYTEQVHITKSLSLLGIALSPKPVITAPPAATRTTYTIPESSRTFDPIVFADGGSGTISITIDNFEIDGNNDGGSNTFCGILCRQTTGTISNNDLHSLRGTGQETMGIIIYGASSIMTISGNTVIDFTRNGITGIDGQHNIMGNTVTADGPLPMGNWAQNGIQMGYGAVGSIIGNTVTGCSIINPSWAASGILPVITAGTIQIDNNIISENEVGVYICDCSASLSGNSVYATSTGTGQSYFYGIIGDPGGPTIAPQPSPYEDDGITQKIHPTPTMVTYTFTLTDNTIDSDGISPGGVGVGVYAGMYGTYDIDFTATCNKVRYWDYGFELYEYAPNKLLSAEIHCNDIVGNTGYGVYNWLTTTFDATCNWWGAHDGPSGAGTGSGDAISSNLLYNPWIHVNADAGGPYTVIGIFNVNFDASGTTTSGCCGETVTYDWNFGDGHTGTGINPTHTYSSFGTYTATLTVTSTTSCGYTYTNTDSTKVYVKAKPDVEIEKYVWDDATSSWVEELRVPIGTLLNFKIIVTNTGQKDLNNLNIKDEMGIQLQYRDNANIPEASVSPDERTIIWDINKLTVGSSMEITFDVEAVQICFGWNSVIVRAREPVIAAALVKVKVISPGQPMIDITKEVWDEDKNEWVSSITQPMGTDMEFKITVFNTAFNTLHNAVITDNLPDKIKYGYDANIDPETESDQQIIWKFDEIEPGENIEIIYSAEAIEDGITETIAEVTTEEEFYDEDQVLVVIATVPDVKLIYPQGGETLSDNVKIIWEAIDDSDPYLDIYLFYSDNNGDTWTKIGDVFENNNEFDWDTTLIPDGTYILMIQAENDYGIIETVISDQFEIGNTGSSNQAPNKPNIFGPASGNVGTEIEYTITGSDPDEDPVYVIVYWDDETDTGWLGPYISSFEIKLKHTWSEEGSYTIKAKAKDDEGKQSDWGTLQISMPRNRAIHAPFLQFLQNFLEQYPILYQLLLRFLQL